MPEEIDAGRTFIYDGLAQNDIDMGSHRLLNLDTSNLPPMGIPPTFHAPEHEWIRDWNGDLQLWESSQPTFDDIFGFLNREQQINIQFLRDVRTGVWNAEPMAPNKVPTLDQIRTPVGNVALGGFRLTGVANPINPNDAVNLAFMDFMLQGLQPKEAVLVATTSSGHTGSGFGPIDGVDLEPGDRILLKNPRVGREYEAGIYVVNEDGVWTRDEDANTAIKLERAYCAVLEGDLNSGTSWVQIADLTDPLGLGDLPNFVLFSSTPGASIIPGSGLTRNGNTLNVIGTANRIVAGPDSVDISPSYTGQDSITNVGTITEGLWHGEIIAPQFGGTGSGHSGVIDLCGDFHTIVAFDFPDVSGNRPLTFRLTAATNVVLPTGGTLATTAGVETFTNKRILKRTEKIASNAKPSINVNAVDCFHITALNENITSMTDNLTGTPVNGQELLIWIYEQSGGDVPIVGVDISWGSAWSSSPDLPLPVSTLEFNRVFLGFVYNDDVTQWVLTQRVDHIP